MGTTICLPLILDDLAQAVEHTRVELLASGAGAGLQLAVVRGIGVRLVFFVLGKTWNGSLHSGLDDIQWVPGDIFFR